MRAPIYCTHQHAGIRQRRGATPRARRVNRRFLQIMPASVVPACELFDTYNEESRL